MAFDSLQFRKALGHFATGVTIATTKTASGKLLGLTANSFTSISLDPPLVLFSLDRKALSLDAFEQSGAFAINILDVDQREASIAFASVDIDKRWQGVEFETWETGAPLLRKALARFDCRTYAVHDGGDHRIFIGRVVRFDADILGNPLIYFRGNYREVK